MTEYTEQMTERLLSDAPRKDSSDRFRIVWLVVIPLVAVLSQVYVPRFVPFLAYLELPLLITVHFALTTGGPIGALTTECSSDWCRIRCRISPSACMES